ncbi:hypothetical protein H6F86_20500 [Phormidium sp. FACHB-592]|uniref:Uncharacterized protein n=1 Tax=Stenomitos frigidus AS-A4 TaxID=2933935 RepID=A0ABV0KEE5_9CYAN|nr:hypothetical protein [Phormidium sp. FACHB-592]MBD2076213.1 hypothetical protein [Phormidium sp. FACHB-592]
MTVTVTITDTQTGRQMALPVDWDNDDALWCSGNNDCDCNLGLLLGVWRLEDAVCGDTRFEVEAIDEQGLLWRRGVDGNEYDRELVE